MKYLKYFLCCLLIIHIQSCGEQQCREQIKDEYLSDEFMRLDLRGSIKSLKVTSGFEEPNEYHQDICGKSKIKPENGLTLIEFSKNGQVKSRESNNSKYFYNNQGELIKKSFINNKGVEYGFANFKYYRNRYYKKLSEYGDYIIDTLQVRTDTSIVVVRGTNDKYYKGNDPLSVAIYREYVINSKGYILEEHGPDIQYPYYYYSYNSNGRLINIKPYYQGAPSWDSVSYNFNERNEFIGEDRERWKCLSSFDYKKRDCHGNWTLLEINVENYKFKIIRQIEYYD